MKRLFRYIMVLLVLCAPFPGGAQRLSQPYPTNYFDPPLRLPVSISGAFAEIRPNHFHSGVDLRIGGKVGEPVYAPADGYVSRINISAAGGGQVLYITHPNGFKTVYMHLNDYVGAIGEFVYNYQYAHHCYAFDVELPVDSIPVRRGQLIAHAGNTGASGGPHLHYEIRYAENDQTINPLYFGINYSDPVSPTIRNIKVYPAEPSAQVNGIKGPVRYTEKVRSGKKTVTLKNDTFRVVGKCYVGIYATDVSELNTSGKNGVERIDLYVDDTLFFRYSVPTFMFEETRVVNALIDYPEYLLSREYYVITRHLRGERSGFSTAYRDNGYLSFGDGGLHKLEYKVYDYKGNVATKRFFIRDLGTLTPAQTVVDSNIDLPGEPITFFRKKTFIRPGFEARFDENTVYDNDRLVFQSYTHPGSMGPVYSLNLSLNPLPPHQAYTLRIATPDCPPSLVEHLVIVQYNGKKRSSFLTRREGNILEAKVKSFGTFGVELDTVPPTVKPQNFVNGGKAPETLTVKISDNLSGLASYHCYLNGEWILASHDSKSSALTIRPAAFLQAGDNELKVVVKDCAHNVTELSFILKK